MPDINRHGHVQFGRGVRFLREDTLIAQRDVGGDVWRVCTRPLAGETWTPITDRGAGRLAARAGHWLAHLVGVGVFGPDGVLGAEMAIVDGAAAEDGTLGVILDYQTGLGLRLQRADGSRLDVKLAPDRAAAPDALDPMPLALAILDRDRALWFDGRTRQIETVGLPRPVVLPGALFAPQILELADGLWLAYHSSDDVGVVLHPFGSLDGYRITTPPAFYLRAVALDGRRVRLAWGANQGDTHGEARTIDVAAEPRIPLAGDEPHPQPTPVPVEDPMSLRPWPRKLWFAPFFSHDDRYGDTPLEAHAGNAIALVEREGDPSVLPREIARVLPLQQALIVGAAQRLEDALLNTIVAWWAAGPTAAALGAAVRRSLAFPARPVIAYLDRGRAEDWPASRPDWVTDRVWPSVQAYRDPGESLQIFGSRVFAALDRVAGYGQPLALTPAFFTRNGTVGVETIVECMGVYEQAIREYPIVCVMPFADRRPTGMLEHPELRAWARAFLRAVVAKPNRYDGWLPEGGSIDDAITNKLRQDVELVSFSPREEARILAALAARHDDDTDTRPPDDPPIEDVPDDFDGLNVVVQARRELYPHVADDEPLPGLREGFRITKRVARRLKAEGFGLVAAKPGSDNDVDGYVSDVVALPDGRHWDVLGSAGERNTAAWNAVPRFGEDGTDYWAAIRPRWRPPLEDR